MIDELYLSVSYRWRCGWTANVVRLLGKDVKLLTEKFELSCCDNVHVYHYIYSVSIRLALILFSPLNKFELRPIHRYRQYTNDGKRMYIDKALF